MAPTDRRALLDVNVLIALHDEQHVHHELASAWFVVSVLDETRFLHAHVHGHRQLTDLYLLALAVKNSARFVTFDAKVALSTVHGAKRHHLVSL